MKKKLTLLLMAVLLTATTFAQTKHTTMLETTRDTLFPEIVGYLGFGEYIHYQHPSSGISCGFDGIFCTIEPYNQYQWEVDEEFLPVGGNLTDPTIICGFTHPGYLKVTVWDSFGNSGIDSVWFPIKNSIEPMPDFTMELDSTNHAVFSGTATSDHRAFFYYRSLDTLSWPQGGEHHDLRPGYWSIRDNDAWFTSDSIWNYKLILIDSCGYYYEQEMVPGMMMSTQPSPGGGWYLTLRTVLQSRTDEDFVYPIFTIDQNGVRHELHDEHGDPVILPASANSLLLSEHPDKYYQGAVARLNRKTRSYEIVSLSNKVENPLPDVNNVNDEIQSPALSIYPNPSHGTFTVKGEGILTIINMLGQTIFQQRIEGESPIRLPAGIYIAKLGSSIQKIVVQ